MPVGTPTITENQRPRSRDDGDGRPNPDRQRRDSITDADGISTPFTLQWQELDVLRGEWVDIVGATGANFVPTTFQEGSLGLRVKASYVDGKGYKETVISTPTAAVTLPGNVNTAPTIVVAAAVQRGR